MQFYYALSSWLSCQIWTCTGWILTVRRGGGYSYSFTVTSVKLRWIAEGSYSFKLLTACILYWDVEYLIFLQYLGPRILQISVTLYSSQIFFWLFLSWHDRSSSAGVCRFWQAKTKRSCKMIVLQVLLVLLLIIKHIHLVYLSAWYAMTQSLLMWYQHCGCSI